MFPPTLSGSLYLTICAFMCISSWISPSQCQYEVMAEHQKHQSSLQWQNWECTRNCSQGNVWHKTKVKFVIKRQRGSHTGSSTRHSMSNGAEAPGTGAGRVSASQPYPPSSQHAYHMPAQHPIHCRICPLHIQQPPMVRPAIATWHWWWWYLVKAITCEGHSWWPGQLNQKDNFMSKE